MCKHLDVYCLMVKGSRYLNSLFAYELTRSHAKANLINFKLFLMCNSDYQSIIFVLYKVIIIMC